MGFASAFKQAGIQEEDFVKIIGREITNGEYEMIDVTTLEDVPKNCENCKWHDDFTGTCCNGDSEHCADFTDNSEVCDCHEDLEDREDE